MSAKRHRVTRGNSHLTIYRWMHPVTGARRWRFAWKDGDAWRYQTHKTKADAEAATGYGESRVAWVAKRRKAAGPIRAAT